MATQTHVWCRDETTINERHLICDRLHGHGGLHLDGYADVFWPQSADEAEEG